MASGFQDISLGSMDGIITSLGIIFGLFSAGQDAGVILIALLGAGLANSFANAAGFYVSEESENIHTNKEILHSSLTSFASTFISVLIVSSPFIFLGMIPAVILSVALILLILVFIARQVSLIIKKSFFHCFSKYIILVIFVAGFTFLLGTLF